METLRKSTIEQPLALFNLFNPFNPFNFLKILGALNVRPYSFAMVHIGIGYDVHALVEGRQLILGGVHVPHTKGLDGHSDADALMHAICDAVLGALGEPDIGHFFPNTDPRWRGVPSKVFLEEAARQVGFRHGKIVNIDSTIIAQQPKLSPPIDAMKINIAAASKLSNKQVGF